MTRFYFRFALLLCVGLGTTTQAASVDSFDSIHPDWVTDRQEPSDGFTSVNFLGDNRLRIGIDASEQSTSGTFYFTEGRKRDYTVADPWSVSADVYIDSAFNTTTGTLVRSDMWLRDSYPDETQANYPIFGFTNASPTDGFNAGAGDRSFRFRAWDSQVGWIDLGLPAQVTFDDWNNLEIVGTGTSFEFYVNGALVHTDLTGSQPGSEDLKSVYLQAYNFGHEDYAVHWDNLEVEAVPEPTGMGLIGLAGLMMVRRRR